MSSDASFAEPAPGRGSFPTTHWSVVINAGAASESQVRTALETLCRQYWYPLYSFIRRQGRAHHEAQDCTQEFLARLLANGAMTTARPERGRFRTFLLTSLRNFLTNEWHRAQASKRGGGETPLSLDFLPAGAKFQQDVIDAPLPPELEFDRTWAQGMIENVIGELRRDYDKSGRGALFAALAPLVWGDESGEALAIPAARIGLTTSTFTVALHRMRKRFGERLRAAVADTVTDESEVDEELRHLIKAISARTSA